MAHSLVGRSPTRFGHYLLGPEHSRAGLMRAEFGPRDVLAGDPKAVSFDRPTGPAAHLTLRRASVHGHGKTPKNVNESSWLARGEGRVPNEATANELT